MSSHSPTAPRKSTSSERRVSERHDASVLFLCRLEDSPEASFAATALDVSQTGACLSLPMRIDAGERVELQVFLSQGREVVRLDAVVRWVQPIEGGVKAGCQFQSSLTLEQMFMLLSS